MNNLFTKKAKILGLVQWSYRSPQFCSLLNLELSCFELVLLLLSSTCLSGKSILAAPPNDIPIEIQRGDPIRHVYLLRPKRGYL